MINFSELSKCEQLTHFFFGESLKIIPERLWFGTSPDQMTNGLFLLTAEGTKWWISSFMPVSKILRMSRIWNYSSCVLIMVGIHFRNMFFQNKVSTQLDRNINTAQWCDLEICSRSLTVIWIGKAQWSGQVWHLLHLQCLRKSQCQSSCHTGQPACWPNSDH